MRNNQKKNLLVIQLNELNFDYAKYYIEKYNLRNLNKLIKLNNCQTNSEIKYECLEPWIQWVTFNTGKSATEHEVFRLGDIENFQDEQIYEKIENLGFSVGAICPMNTVNRLKNPDFFISDPWTKTKGDKNYFNNLISRCLSDTINNNSQKKVGFLNYLIIILSILKFVRFKKYSNLFKILSKIFFKKWYRVILLEFLLHEIYIYNLKINNTDFSSIFFNGAAHIQHHYFFNLENFKGDKNPEWYVKNNEDPFKDTLIFYNQIIGDYLKLNKDFLVVTGLSQIPYKYKKYYYRINNPGNFLNTLNIKHKNTKSRMTRDFLINFDNDQDTNFAHKKLSILTDLNGNKLFEEIDIRKKSLFVTLTYPFEIKNEFEVNFENKKINLEKYISFVALKNGMHDGKGFAFTNIENFFERNSKLELKSFFNKIQKYFKNEKN